MRRSRATANLLTALTAAAALACAGFQVSVDYDPDEDFSSLRTFAWYGPPSSGTAVRHKDLWQLVRPKIEWTLKQKGYTRAARASADFLVNYHLSLERRFDTRTINAPYRTSGNEWEVHRTVRKDVVVEYDIGTLVIDVLDPRTRRLVWRGTANKRLERDPNAQDVEGSIATVLARFPPD
jgi:hypothetical protein